MLSLPEWGNISKMAKRPPRKREGKSKYRETERPSPDNKSRGRYTESPNNSRDQYAESPVISIEEAQRIRREKRAEVLESSKYRKRRKQAEAMASARAARKSFASGRRLLFLLIAVSIACIVILAGSRINGLQQKQAEAARDLRLKTEQRDRLENELSAVKDPEYIEAQARERLHMIKRGEILYIIENDKKEDDKEDTSG